MQWRVKATIKIVRYIVLIGVSVLMISGLSASARGSSESTSGPDITGLQLDGDLADVFPEDEAMLAGDADEETKDGASDFQEVHLAADITGLDLDGNLADIFDEDDALAAAAGFPASTVAPDITGLDLDKDLADIFDD